MKYRLADTGEKTRTKGNTSDKAKTIIRLSHRKIFLWNQIIHYSANKQAAMCGIQRIIIVFKKINLSQL